jgi:predicted adenylyl cyclase CyaB
MNTETEIKFRLDDPRQMRRRILQAGGQALGAALEDNVYFDTPAGRLRQADSGLRIRTVAAPDRREETTLTYKGPRLAKEMSIRPEENLHARSAESAQALVEALGFRPIVRFQKRRESFQLGPAKIELDELPRLGFFMEIEAPDEAAVQQARRLLGLEDAQPVKPTYLAMVMELLASEKPPASLRF